MGDSIEASAHGNPLVSVVVVNFNGERFLRDLFHSLASQTYTHFETLLVDNGSTDGSLALVRKKFPRVRVIEAGRNLGFTGGNNLGMTMARGTYCALVNNDAVPEPGWLENLVREGCRSPAIGAVTSKVLFARPFLSVTFEAQIPDTGSSSNGAQLFLGEDSGFVACGYRKRVFAAGFGAPTVVDGCVGRWAESGATAFLPVELREAADTLCLKILGGGSRPQGAWRVRVGAHMTEAITVVPRLQERSFAVPANVLREESFNVINNAGSFLRPDGFAADRGIYEPDRGQYDSACDVEALCGCAVLLSRAALDVVGGFDDDFFTYFEDSELSWRLRKAGYVLRYQPASVVRHVHAGTSDEGSSLFTFFVARNRILMLLKHGSPREALRAYLLELVYLRQLWKKARRTPGVAERRAAREAFKARLRVQWSLATNGPRSLLKRWGLLSHSKLPRRGDVGS